MVKYKPELKAQIVNEYLSTSQSTYDLGEKYQICLLYTSDAADE